MGPFVDVLTVLLLVAMGSFGNESRAASAVGQIPPGIQEVADSSSREPSSEAKSAVSVLLKSMVSALKAFNDTANSVVQRTDDLGAELDSAGLNQLLGSDSEPETPPSSPSASDDQTRAVNTDRQSQVAELVPAPVDPLVAVDPASAAASQGRAVRAVRLLVAFLGLILAIGLCRVLLHINHLTHGNYTGRLQLLGWVGTLLLIASAIALSMNDQVWELSDTNQQPQRFQQS